MPVDPMFWLATAAFAWGLSLASYRWFAVHNAWPMGEWQAHRPGLPIAIGLFAMLFALLFALARGSTTALVLPLFGVVCALAWTALTRVGAQSALLLAPIAVAALLVIWLSAAAGLTDAERALRHGADTPALAPAPQLRSSATRATERERDLIDRDTGDRAAVPADTAARRPAATERERDIIDRDRAIVDERPDLRPPVKR